MYCSSLKYYSDKQKEERNRNFFNNLKHIFDASSCHCPWIVFISGLVDYRCYYIFYHSFSRKNKNKSKNINGDSLRFSRHPVKPLPVAPKNWVLWKAINITEIFASLKSVFIFIYKCNINVMLMPLSYSIEYRTWGFRFDV